MGSNQYRLTNSTKNVFSLSFWSETPLIYCFTPKLKFHGKKKGFSVKIHVISVSRLQIPLGCRRAEPSLCISMSRLSSFESAISVKALATAKRSFYLSLSIPDLYFMIVFLRMRRKMALVFFFFLYVETRPLCIGIVSHDTLRRQNHHHRWWFLYSHLLKFLNSCDC